MPVNPILEPSLTGSTEVSKSEFLERLEGFAPHILNYHGVSREDVLIIISSAPGGSKDVTSGHRRAALVSSSEFCHRQLLCLDVGHIPIGGKPLQGGSARRCRCGK